MECQGKGVHDLRVEAGHINSSLRGSRDSWLNDILFIIKVEVVENASKLGNDLTRETVDVSLYAIQFEYSAHKPIVFT